jgi:hypothetical protein
MAGRCHHQEHEGHAVRMEQEETQYGKPRIGGFESGLTRIHGVAQLGHDCALSLSY